MLIKNRVILKRIITFSVCILLLGQNSIGVFALENTIVLEKNDENQNNTESENATNQETKKLEEASDIENRKSEESVSDQDTKELEEVSDVENKKAEEGATDQEVEEPEEDSNAEDKTLEKSETGQELEESVEDGNAEDEKSEESATDQEVEELEEDGDAEGEKSEESATDQEVKFSKVDSNAEDEKPGDDEDPQYGRENGYLDKDFLGVQVYSDLATEYIHDNKFDGYIINDVIDVSKYQEEIDWLAVKADGIDYAIIRAGFRGYGESGSLNIDDKFQTNMQGAIAAGLKVGVYFFSQAITEEEAEEEAEYVLGLISEYNVSLPIVIDYEYAFSSEGLTGRLYNADLSKENATKICKQFCETVEKNGYTAMVYANKSMLEEGLNAAEIAKSYKIWLANYALSTSYEGEYDFWQYTQNGTVNGISGNVDKSFWYEKSDTNYVEISEGIYTISSCLDNSMVVNIPNASVENNVNVQIAQNNGSWEQKFYIRPEGKDTYIVMSANSGKVLEVSGGSYTNYKKICQNDYKGTSNQQWRFIENADGSYTLESTALGMVIDIAGGSSKSGTCLQLYTSNKTAAQKFQLNIEEEESIRLVDDGVYFIETALCEDKVVNVKSNVTDLELSTLKVTDHIKFQVEYADAGCYKISSKLNQKLLTSSQNTKVVLEDENTEGLNQKWILKRSDGDTYTIISAKDGMNLDIAGGKTVDGTIVQKYSGNATKSQQFLFYESRTEDEVLEEGIYIIRSGLDDEKVLDVASGSRNSGANIQLYSENGTAAQKFVVKRLDDGSYSIRSYHSGMLLSVKDNKNINGTNVLQYHPTGANGQRWNIVPAGKEYYRVVSKAGNKVLDVANGKATNGANIQVYTSNGTPAQKFRFEKVGTLGDATVFKDYLENGTYTICSMLNEEKVLDIKGGSLYAGANVQLYTSNNTMAQQFVIQRDAENGFYTINSKHSGMRMTYEDGTLKNSTNVYQHTAVDEDGKQWRLKQIIGDYYMIYAADSSYCLDVANGKANNGANIQIYSANGTTAQIFRIKKISDEITTKQNTSEKIEEGIYTISTMLDNSKVLDVASGSKQNGANIQLYQSNNTSSQQFEIKQLENGSYTIIALCSGKLLTAQNGGVTNGTNVCQSSDNGSTSQQWEITLAGKGEYIIQSVQSDKVLDVANGKATNGTNIQIYQFNLSTAQKFKITPVAKKNTATFIKNNNSTVTLEYDAILQGKANSTDNNYYLMEVENYTNKIIGNPLGYTEKGADVSIRIELSERRSLKEISMHKLVLAVKLGDGSYQAITKPVNISNLEALASNTTAVYQGTSKKGLQGITFTSLSDDAGKNILDARNANTKHTLLNLDLATIVSPVPKAGFEAYTYKGNTYYFDELVSFRQSIESLNAGYKQYLYGNNDPTKVAVTICLLLSYNPETSYLIDPTARTPGHSYYMLNVREEKARETFEALFLYLGEAFGQENCYVSNWILGNEINSSKAWNYSGSLDFDTYMECYATAFRLLYNGVKSTKTGNTVSISLDNGWTVAPDTYVGKTTLDTFAKKIHAQNPNIKWSIAYHPYSYPLTRVDFWNDYSNTTDSLSTRYISMRNISVLTNYAAALENSYGLPSGSIRVLLTEQGYSYSGGDQNQAMAIARGYYIAEFNDRIDAFIIRSVIDDPDEAQAKLYFGLMNRLQEKRIAFFVYEHMDSNIDQFKNISPVGYVSEENYDKFNKAKAIVCNTNWNSIVPGFSKAKLANIK